MPLNKCILRYGGIFFVISLYSATLFFNVINYAVSLKYSDIPVSNEPMPSVLCNRVISDLSMFYNNTVYVALGGYFISIALILLIYKKVR